MAPLNKDSDFYHEFNDSDVVVDQTKTFAPLDQSESTTPRRISFSAIDTIHLVESVLDFTAEEIEATWYNEDEQHTMKGDARSTVYLIDSGFIVDNSDIDFCIRGLETRTKDGAARKFRNRKDAYHAVMGSIDEQHRNEVSIADYYYAYSKRCLVTAQMLAKQDEIEAMKIHYEKTPLASSFLRRVVKVTDCWNCDGERKLRIKDIFRYNIRKRQRTSI